MLLKQTVVIKISPFTTNLVFIGSSFFFLKITIVFRALQEAQDIFGVDFDYDEFDKYGDEDYDEEEDDDEDEYVDEEGLEDTERR